jgi:hypothetical protein
MMRLIFTSLLLGTLLLSASDDGHLSAPLRIESRTVTAPSDSILPIADAAEITAQFRTKYAEAKRPRLVLYINRDLLVERGELVDLVKIERSQQVKGDRVDEAPTANVQIGQNNNTTSGGTLLNPTNTGLGGEKKETAQISVRDQPAINRGVSAISDYEAREIEEVFADKFSAAGARWVDQKVATKLLKTFGQVSDRMLTANLSNKEQQELDALKQSADIAIEILARKKRVTIPTPAGDTTEERLELTATAMDLRQPGLILGRVASNSLFGFNQRDGKMKERRAKKVTSAEIIDQVSLALMNRISF